MTLVPATSGEHGADPNAAVDSVFGRTGVVIAATNDYTPAQVGALAATAAAGGDLTGNFPNPTVGAAKITAAKLASGAALTGTLATADGAGGVTYLAPALTGQQAAIADLNLGALVLLTDVITALGTVQGKVNTLLAELRTAGVLHV